MSTPSVENLRSEYWAFISYRHLDNQQPGREWATWLHQQLENYEVSEDLVGMINERGDTIPDRIFPVFRDEEELPADANLAESVKAAVERSKYMIVLCSPRSAESRYVGEEVAYFKQLGKGDRLIAVIIEGEPNSSWDIGKQKAGASPYQECFPKALMHPIGPDGVMDESVRAEPIAADFRILPAGQQGWTNPAAYREALEAQGTHRTKAIRELVGAYEKKLALGMHKVLAGALGVPLSTLTQREKAFQLEKARRRTRSLAAWLSVSLLLAAAAAAGGGFGWVQMLKAQSQARIAEEQRMRADENAAIAKENAAQARVERDRARENAERALLSEAEAKKQRDIAEDNAKQAANSAWIASVKAYRSERTFAALTKSLEMAGWLMYDVGQDTQAVVNQKQTVRMNLVRGLSYILLASAKDDDTNLKTLKFQMVDPSTGTVHQADISLGPVEVIVINSAPISGEVEFEMTVSEAYYPSNPCGLRLLIGNRRPGYP